MDGVSHWGDELDADLSGNLKSGCSGFAVEQFFFVTPKKDRRLPYNYFQISLLYLSFSKDSSSEQFTPYEVQKVEFSIGSTFGLWLVEDL